MLDPTAPNALPTSSSAVPTSPLSPTDEDGAMVATKKEDGGTDKNTGGGSGGEGDQSGIVKANKGMILRKSVEYIRYLQQLVSAQGARNRELEQQLKMYRSGSATASSPDGGVSSSAAMNGDGPIHQMHTPSSSNNGDGSRSPKGRQRDRDQEEEEDEDPMEMDIEGGRVGKTSSKVKPKMQRMEDGAVGVERGRRRRDSVKVGARSGGLVKKRVKEERDVDMVI
ncbi:hypothetical protein BDN71DRAFT_1182000 [Pleurotus eryngii]|uniref:BHLH domain-containing protein n=1 Tax=Pleurotus eryngii TaxID=5323 RepID=A0A9P6D4Q6_PLEER|nr:hypothetical protein BDN71DRAFT_1182000 [Pleurotus eryngii]